jgi:translation initiation factor IF-2
MRIFDIAKKLGMSTKELMVIIQQLGIHATSHMGTLSETDNKILLDHFKTKGKTEEKKSSPAPTKKPKQDAVLAIAPMISTPKANIVKATQKGSKPLQAAPPPVAPPPEKKSIILIKKKRPIEPTVTTSIETQTAAPTSLISPVKDTLQSVSEKSPQGTLLPQGAQPSQGTLPPQGQGIPSPKGIPSTIAAIDLAVSPQGTLPSQGTLPPQGKEGGAKGTTGSSTAVVDSVVPLRGRATSSPLLAEDRTSPLLTVPYVIPPDAPKKPVSAPASTEAKVEKKKGKEESKPDVKKVLLGKPKDRERKDGPIHWDIASGTTETPAAQKRKWQDFRPTRKRQDAKTMPKGQTPVVEATKPRRKVIKLYEGLTVKEFSELVGEKVSTLISKLMQVGKMLPINQPIGLEDALFLAEEFGVKAELVSEKTEDEILRPPTLSGANKERESPRPPVITIMGHVDHGKTSLLDAIRQTKVVEGESGGITQHIGAYTVTIHGKAVTFIDTPGHEAFTAMRARGAKVTDIVVLVVAADDGVMPQTVEAINHAKAADVPIVVAINKIDKPEANPERIKIALSDYGLIPESWGGKTIYVEVSAKQKIGLDHFLEMILLQADVMELKGNPDEWMEGVIIEAKLSRGRGPVATVLVQKGTLKVGDAFVAGVQASRVRALVNDMGQNVQQASLSMPVEVIGFAGVPAAGDTFTVTENERVAKEVAQSRMHRQRLIALTHAPRLTLNDLYEKIKAGNVEELRLVIKSDVQGSAGALSEAIEKLSTAAVRVRVIHKGVGGITESDALLASASNAILIGFNVRPDVSATSVIEREKIDLRIYSIIYDAIEDVKKAMEGLLAPTYKEKVIGRADVRQTFHVPKGGTICGSYVTQGMVSRGGAQVRVLRDQVVIYTGKIGSLRRFKDDVKEVTVGFECGIGVENFNDVKVGDVLEVYVQEEIATKL